MNITFAVGVPCAGGNHFDVIADIDGRKKTYHHLHLEVLPTDDEIDEAVGILVRHMLVRETDKRQTSIKTRMERKTINLDLS